MSTTRVKVVENDDGDLCFELPDDLLDRLGWEEGDDIQFIETSGSLFLTKSKTETRDDGQDNTVS
tara:strand:+ start:778 stop:972 length:195 start_codon:yes stop_codon:yes gene_type:complete